MSKYASKYKGKKIQSSQNKLNTIFSITKKYIKNKIEIKDNQKKSMHI